MQTSFILNPEVRIVRGLDTLRRNVLLNHFVRDIATRTYEVASAPQVPAPERPVQRSEVSEHAVARLALHGLHHSARGNVRRHGQEDMDMILANVTFEDFDIKLPAYLADEFPDTFGDLATQNRLAVLRRKDEVVLEIVDRVGGLAVVLHGGSLWTTPKRRKPAKAFA